MLRTVTLLIALLCAGPALGCGNPLLWAVLFARVPEAKQVFDADLAAREAGSLQARVFDTPNAGVDYHRWSMRWLDDAAQTLNASVVVELREGESVTILLADEVAALRFERSVKPKVISAAGLDFAEGFDAITTINALESGMNHGLTSEQMIDQGVLFPVDSNRQRIIASLF